MYLYVCDLCLGNTITIVICIQIIIIKLFEERFENNYWNHRTFKYSYNSVRLLYVLVTKTL